MNSTSLLYFVSFPLIFSLLYFVPFISLQTHTLAPSTGFTHETQVGNGTGWDSFDSRVKKNPSAPRSCVVAQVGRRDNYKGLLPLKPWTVALLLVLGLCCTTHNSWRRYSLKGTCRGHFATQLKTLGYLDVPCPPRLGRWSQASQSPTRISRLCAQKVPNSHGSSHLPANTLKRFNSRQTKFCSRKLRKVVNTLKARPSNKVLRNHRDSYKFSPQSVIRLMVQKYSHQDFSFVVN